MNTPKLNFIHNRRHDGSPNKETPIELRIYFEGKTRILHTGLQCTTRQYRNGLVVNRPDAAEMNDVLQQLMRQAREVVREMLEEGNINIGTFSERLRRKNQGKMSFIEFCERRLRERQYGLSKDSKQRYDRFMKFFLQWGGIEYFEDITDSNIIAFDEWLDKKKMTAYSKWNNYHRFLNSFLLDAAKEGLLTRNPYHHLRIKKEKSRGGLGKYLTPEQFEAIKTVELATPHLERVRDLFVFQTFTCLAYKDLAAFRASKITEVKGMKVYVGQRHKTGQTFTVPLVDEALAILKKYRNKLPIISNVKYNEYLKVVGQAAGITKPISSHWARHTGATMLLNKGIAMNIVSKICGHSSTRITEEVYAKLLDETVVDAIQNIENKKEKNN